LIVQIKTIIDPTPLKTV